MRTAHKIIALHGAGMNGHIYDGLPFDTLSLPGHADEALCLTDIQSMASWVTGQLTAPVILLGHSMGALVALQAASHPFVTAIILLGAAPLMPVNPDLLKSAADTPDAARVLILKWGVSKNCVTADAIKEKYLTIMQQTTPMALYHDLFACDAYQDGAAVVAQLQKPMLVIAGSDDKMAKPDASRAMARAAALGTYVEIQGCGHMIMAEKPAEMMNEIKAFTDTLPR